MKKKKIILGILVVCSLLVLICFLNTSFGKLQTIKYRGYIEISDNIYLDEACDAVVREEVLTLIEESLNRVETFWGDLESKPVLIFSESQQKLDKLGVNVSSAATRTYIINGAKDYIFILIPKVNVDILSHELSHAELHKRVYEGEFFSSPKIPMWFDEGLAMQVDYREKYNNDAWMSMIEIDGYQKQLSELVTASQFFVGDADERTKHYILSRHSVKVWYAKDGHDKLMVLIQGLKDGDSFDELYFEGE